MSRNRININEKIDQAKADVLRANKRYDAADEHLKQLQKQKDEKKKAELWTEIESSGLDYDEIIGLLKKHNDETD